MDIVNALLIIIIIIIIMVIIIVIIAIVVIKARLRQNPHKIYEKFMRNKTLP